MVGGPSAPQPAGKGVASTDDTPVPVLDPELPHTRAGRIWTCVGDAAHPYKVSDDTPNRSRALVTREIALGDVTDTLERMTRLETVGFEVITRFS
jgi:hypothetical protein